MNVFVTLKMCVWIGSLILNYLLFIVKKVSVFFENYLLLSKVNFYLLLSMRESDITYGPKFPAVERGGGGFTYFSIGVPG